MMKVITDLPPEILVLILSYLEFRDIFACRTAHSTFNRLSQDYQIIGYQVSQQLNDVEDNPSAKLPVAEKLRHLESSQYGWMHAHTQFEEIIPIRHPMSGLYDLTGGIYFSGNRSRNALYYYKLPDEPNEGTEWRHIKVEPGRTIVDFGLSVYEHNLLVILTKRASPNVSNSWTLEIQLFDLSTHDSHPEAKQPLIAVYEAQWSSFTAYIEIVRESLFLIIHHASDFAGPDDHFLVYNWRTGHLKMSISASYCSLYGLVPISEDKVVIMNASARSLDLWRVSDNVESQPTQPERSLRLPLLGAQSFLRSISCRGEPNPATAFPFSRQPYHSNPDNALIIFTISIQTGEGNNKFLLVTKRNLLLDLFPDQRESGIEWKNEDGSKHLNPSEDQDDEPETVAWESWGPSRSRMIRLSSERQTWITISGGQRLVNVRPEFNGRTQTLEIYDFNPERIRKTESYLKEQDDSSIRVVRKRTQIPGGYGFASNVKTGLPYSMVESRGFPDLYLVLMDEHRIIGFSRKDNDDDNDEDDNGRLIRVFYIGRK